MWEILAVVVEFAVPHTVKEQVGETVAGAVVGVLVWVGVLNRKHKTFRERMLEKINRTPTRWHGR